MQEMGKEPTFGERLRQLRQAKGLTQRELAERVATLLREEDRRGFDFTYLSKIENDRMRPPSAAAIRQLAAVLNADGDDLLALAGKVPTDLGDMLKESPAARAYFRSAKDMGLSEKQWRDLLEELKKRKGGK